MDTPSQREIQRFWDENPVNADFIQEPAGRAFFEAYDRRRQETEGHIRAEVMALPIEGARILEIGLGQGTESQLLAEAAAEYVGVDLTPESVRRVRQRFEFFEISGGQHAVMSGERVGFRDETFDLVFCHGVIHHSPRPAEIVAEIHRVLRPGGIAVAMLYHRHSLNYHVSIRFVRRVGIFALSLPGVARAASTLTGEPLDRLSVHTKNLRSQGLEYLRMRNFIHRSTDGPYNAYSSVWTEPEATELFSAFRDVCFRRHHLNERHLPGLKALLTPEAKRFLASRFGWHLWIYATK